MDQKYHPFPDYESALKWLEERGCIFTKRGVRVLPSEDELAWTIADERLDDSEMVFVRGCDPELPEPDLKKAMANHFSSCGEILQLDISDRVACIRILGEGAKEKLEQLDGSDLGGFKLDLNIVDPTRSPPAYDSDSDTGVYIPTRAGYVLPESARRNLELIKARSEKRFKRRVEKEMMKLSLNKKDNQAKKIRKHSSKKMKKMMKKKKDNQAL